jgi:hypothetical protein
LASQDQFKSIRSVESQRQDTETTYKQLQKQYSKAIEDLNSEKHQTKELKCLNEGLEVEIARSREREQARESFMKSLESRLRRFEEESDANGALNAKLQSETASLSSENVQLKKDMSWLANQA